MKKYPKLLAMLLCIAMVASLIMTPITAQAATGYWSANTNASGFTGSGTSYTVSSEAGLAHFASLVNAGNDFAGATITLANDLDLSAHYWVPIGWFPPQGSSNPERVFNGTFDGGGHYIDGMTIGGSNYNTGSGANNEGNALFGIVGVSGTVKNVGMLNVYVDGYRRSAAIAGANRGTIENCMSTGEIFADGGGSDRGSGGIVGTNYGTVKYCYSDAEITNAYRRAGGIVGYNDTGAVIDHCFFTGFATSNSATYSGSIACTNNVGATITNCYYLENSANDAQDNGCPSGYANGAQAAEFKADGTLTVGGTSMLAAIDGSGTYFKSVAGSDIPILAWETVSHSNNGGGNPPQPPEPVAVTIKSTQGFFADISVTLSELKAYTTTNTNYERYGGGGALQMTYSTVEGITLADLVEHFIPDGEFATEVGFADSTDYTSRFNPQNSAHDSAMLLWSAINAADSSETLTNSLRAALDGGAGSSWASNVIVIRVTLPMSDVTFSTTPAGASVEVKRGSTVIQPVTPGGKVYSLIQGETYSYGVTAASYVGTTGSVTPNAATQTVTVALTTGGGGGGGGTTYTVSGYTGANGSVTPNLTSAEAGRSITLTVTPASGYALSALSVSGSTLNQPVSGNTNTYTFSMPNGNATVSATFEPIVLTLYSQQGANAARVKAAVFTKTELSSISNTVEHAYMYYQNSAWRAIVATELVTLDSLFSAGGISARWKSGSYLAFDVSSNSANGPGVGPYDKSYPDYSDINKCKYYVNDSGAYVEIPAGIAIDWNSGALDVPPGRDASVSTIAAGSYDSGSLRFVYGVSQESYTGPTFAAGARSPSSVVEITLIYDAPTIPGGSVGTTHDSNNDKDDADKDTDDDKTDDGTDTGENLFSDVKTSDWFHDAVEFVVEAGLFRGVSENSFAPNTTMTRAMLVTALYRLEGESEVSGNSEFNDVSDLAAYYYDAVLWASQSGIVTGYSDSEFGANDNVTREQMVTILYRYAIDKGYDVSVSDALSSFTDAESVSPWALDAMKWAVAVGLINGTTETTISPAGNATRAQVATILQRFVENVVK